MKKRLPRSIALALVAVGAISIATVSIAWFAKQGTTTDDTQAIDGQIGLRGYFYDGTGDLNDPYEIVTQQHLYNLCRLQNLGVFPEKKYFTVGHVFEGDSERRCINYNEGVPNYDAHLDMANCPFPITPIGSESTPFVGEFQGNGIPIQNLTVRGYPEDIGLFGYVAHDGLINGLVCENIEVVSLGYNNSSSSEMYQLFNPEIDDLFAQGAHRFVSDTDLKFTYYNGSSYSETTLKRVNGLGGVSRTHINAPELLVSGTDVMNAYFTPIFPQNDAVFTYSWRSSSPIVKSLTVMDVTGDGNNDPLCMIDLTPLKESTEGQSSFNSGNPMEIDMRLSLYATVEVGGYIYSRVIQSYLLEFFSNSSIYENGNYSLSIYCDYVTSTPDSDHPATNYHHGNNIGLLVGHLDGSLTNSFVYKGKFSFNNQTQYHPIMTESDSGLVGEVGKNVMNGLDPEIGLVNNGDIGIMNFTKIYTGIRSDYVVGNTYKAGHDNLTDANYISYDTLVNTSETSLLANYDEYLRKTPAKDHYINDAAKYIPEGTVVDPGDNERTWHNYTVQNNDPEKMNSVDFLWNNVIADDKEHNKDRGLGVFKIATIANSGAKTGAYSDYAFHNMGASSIINGKKKSKVYFSTAEYDHVKSNTSTAWPEYDPYRAVTIPSYSDTLSFDYPFSRDYNYVFEMNLEQINALGGNNFLSNTDSSFLSNYLYLKLIDKWGKSITRGSARFGFMFRTSNNEIMDGLSSYMPVGNPSKSTLVEYDDGNYYPSNSIIFHIDNENGANVSVVGNKNNITIYSYDPTGVSKAITPLYTMMCKNNTSDVDNHRYFEYDASTGVTGTETKKYGEDDEGTGANMQDDNALFAHIFKLPPGDYAIGSAHETEKANIYFLCVQGQTDAELDSTTMTFLGDELSNCDFLTEAPTRDGYYADYALSQFTFNVMCNDNSGTLNVDIMVADKKYINVVFKDAPIFVYFVAYYSKDSTPDVTKGFINGTGVTKSYEIVRDERTS